MTDEELKQPNSEMVSPSSTAIIRKGDRSDIQLYKDVLSEKFASAKTPEECATLISLRQEVQALDIEARRLEYAEKSANIQLQEAKQATFFQRIQQTVASISALGIGVVLLQSYPLASLLFLILGLAKPLGYSLGEVNELLSGIKGFPKDPDSIVSDKIKQEFQQEEVKDVRL